jgi:hypothetical protein
MRTQAVQNSLIKEDFGLAHGLIRPLAEYWHLFLAMHPPHPDALSLFYKADVRTSRNGEVYPRRTIFNSTRRIDLLSRILINIYSHSAQASFCDSNVMEISGMLLCKLCAF